MAADARLPSDWLGDPRYDVLSDAEWRVFTAALMYANLHLTDGRIPEPAARLLHPTLDAKPILMQLVERKVFTWHADGDPHWKIVDYLKSQSSRKQIETYKENNRKRQAEWRKNHPAAPVPNETPAPAPEPKVDTTTGELLLHNPSPNALPNAAPNGVRRKGQDRTGNELGTSTNHKIDWNNTPDEAWVV